MTPKAGNQYPTPHIVLDDESVVPAEEFLGKTIAGRGGVSYLIDSIEAVESMFVVFAARNMETGELDSVIKQLRADYDPRRTLMDALPVAMQNVERDPDRAIQICDELLALDPSLEAAAFNKGVALLVVKNDVSNALGAFDLAISLAPLDILNLIFRASCLSRLMKDDECLRDIIAVVDVLKATGQDGRLSEYINQLLPHGRVIRQSLKRIARAQPTNQRARQLLCKYFGMSFRRRLALHSLRSALPFRLRKKDFHEVQIAGQS